MSSAIDKNICTNITNITDQINMPASPAIFQTSTFLFDTYEEFLKKFENEEENFIYTRGSNPTTKKLEELLTELERGEKAKVFSSGMGAISATLISLLKRDDHILMVNSVYSTAVSLGKFLEKFGVKTSHVNVNKTEEISNYLLPETRMIYFESPSSQKFRLLDLESISKIANEKNIYTVIDSTWSTPLFQKPLNHGIDIVIHSLSKYIGGHSDVVGGVVVGKKTVIDNIIKNGHQLLGAVNSPSNSWLAIRGLRTLPTRMSYYNNSVIEFIDFLKCDNRIGKIYHPYASNDEYQYKLSKKYLKGYSSLLSFELKNEDYEKLKEFVNTLEYFSIGISWGGFESLILPSFRNNNEEKLKSRGIKKSHIRLYIGLEDINTLINDFKQALDKVYEI